MDTEDQQTTELLQRLQRSCSIRRSNSTPTCTCDVVCDGSCRQGNNNTENDENDVSGDNEEDEYPEGIDVDAPREAQPEPENIEKIVEEKLPSTEPSAIPPPSRPRRGPPAIIEYMWHGGSLGLEICRSKTKQVFNQTRIPLKWKHGPIGITFSVEKATRQVYVKRVQRDIGNIYPGFVLVLANGVVVTERNFDEVIQELKRNHELGREQILEFVPPPPPPMARVVSSSSPLYQLGVSVHYELMLIGDTRTLYLTLPEIQHCLQTSPRPCKLTFCYNPAAYEHMMVQRKPEGRPPVFDHKVVAAAAIAAVICL
ncbi:hypothetical protein THRCLA_01262 [Thraustotheca clavata]|uniref:PDZ domain-containing protein n=1 Tax=Thraustotheca clavata TaxID=74557 RepID=A0A1W0A8S9_9STRA|nr:hypothetical protein THRCLA_01262 [Thraustotheca clavata]